MGTIFGIFNRATAEPTAPPQPQPARASLPPLPSGGSSADLHSAMAARDAAARKSVMRPAELEAGLNELARQAAKKLGLDVKMEGQPFQMPTTRTPIFYQPWPHVHLRPEAFAHYAAEQKVDLLTAKELEELRNVVKRAADIEAVQIANAPQNGDNVTAFLEKHNGLKDTPGWLSIDREQAKLTMRNANKLREVEKRKVFAEAVPILERLGERLAQVLQSKLLKQLEVELLFAHQNQIPFQPSILLASVDTALGKMPEYREQIRYEGHVPTHAFGGLVNLLLK